MLKIFTIAATTFVGAALLAAAPGVSAQEASPAPSQPPSQSGTMNHQGMMQGGSKMPMMEQMSKMMENCNRMMQAQKEQPNKGGSGEQPRGNPG